MKKILLPLCTALLTAGTVQAQFSASNLAVLEAASATSNNTTGSIVELNKTTASQTPVNTYTIPGSATVTNGLRFSGSATSTMYMANSNDRTQLCFTGANTINTVDNINTILTRGVGIFNPAGTYSLATTYTGASGSQTRCATTVNNTDYYIADQGGIYTNNATAGNPTGNFRGIKSFGGTVYVSSASGTATVIQVSTISAPTAGTLTALPGLTNNSTLTDFYLVRSGSNGTTFDVLYVSSASSNTAGTIAKYSLVSGTWTANGTYTTAFGGFGLAAEQSGTGANLYVSTGAGALAANSVLKLFDAAGYNATINITTANNVTLYTAGTTATVKGVAFAPAAVAVPTLTVTPSATLATTFTASVNTASTSDSFTVTGSNLSSNVTVTAPASFQVATTLNGTYGSTVTLTPTAGSLASTKVYVRFFPTATGTVSGNVVVSATGATSQNVAVTGATPTPALVATSSSTITNTFITPVNTPSNSDSITVSGSNLTGNVTVTASASFQVATTLNGTYASSVTLTPANNALAATKVYVRFLPTAAGTVNGTITVSSAGATAQVVNVTGATPGPIVLATSSATIASGFIASLSAPSPSDSITVNGSNLTGNVTVTASASFQVATTLNGTYSSSVTLTPTNGTLAATKVYVRFFSGVAGVVNGTITISSAGATSQVVNVVGTTPPPAVVATPSATVTTAFTSIVNTPSTSDSITVSGTNLTGNVTVTASASFQVATTLNGTYSSSVTLTPANNALPATKVYVRFLPTAAGSVTGTITISSNGATSQVVNVSGNAATPVITASMTSIATSFAAPVGGTSASDTFRVSATALYANLTVTAPANFEVSTSQAGSYSSSLTLTPTNGVVASTLIYVRFHPTTAGVFTDTVKVTSTGAVTRNVVVTGFTSTATNPVAFNLSTGNYLMSQWDSTNAAGTYPLSMIFHTTNLTTPVLTTAPLVNNWVCPYNLTSRPRVKGLNGDGFSMINTGSPQYDNCSSGAIAKNTFMGAALLAVSTSGKTDITLKYNAGLVKQGDGATPRVYNLRLQYRLDSTSAFANMSPVSEYTSAGKADGDLQTFTIALPAAMENQPYLEFRWLYYADTSVTGASGTRPEIRLDEIGVSVKPTGLAQLPGGTNGIRVYPNPVTGGSELHFSAAFSGRMIDAFGRTVASFEKVNTLETRQLAAGIYTILAADGGRYRIVIQ